MGGECNYLLRVRPDDKHLEYVPDEEWQTPEMKCWKEEDIQVGGAAHPPRSQHVPRQPASPHSCPGSSSNSPSNGEQRRLLGPLWAHMMACPATGAALLLLLLLLLPRPQGMLTEAQAILEEGAARLCMPVQVVRKSRSVGVVPTAPTIYEVGLPGADGRCGLGGWVSGSRWPQGRVGFVGAGLVGAWRAHRCWQRPVLAPACPQVLEELALTVQQQLLAPVPFCAFNGGNDVFVDVGAPTTPAQAPAPCLQQHGPAAGNTDARALHLQLQAPPALGGSSCGCGWWRLVAGVGVPALRNPDLRRAAVAAAVPQATRALAWLLCKATWGPSPRRRCTWATASPTAATTPPRATAAGGGQPTAPPAQEAHPCTAHVAAARIAPLRSCLLLPACPDSLSTRACITPHRSPVPLPLPPSCCSIVWVANPEETGFFVKRLVNQMRSHSMQPYIE
jgi:hypothetical protein